MQVKPAAFAKSRYKFTKEQRLLTNADFDKVFKNAVFKASRKHILLLAIENQLPHARIGIIVGKKKVRRANKRNNIKRVMRESFRLNQYQLCGLDIVAIAKIELELLTKQEIRECLDKLWKSLLSQYKK